MTMTLNRSILIGYSKRSGIFWATFRLIMAKNDIISLKEKIALLEEDNNALITEKQRLIYLLAASPAIIYSFEAKGDYQPTFISGNIKKMFGYEPSEYLENPRFMPSHIHPDDINRIDKEWSHLFRVGRHVIEYRFRRKNGTYCWVNDEIHMIRDKDGEPLEMLVL